MILLSSSSLNGYGIHRVFLMAKKAGFDGLDLVLTKENLDLWDEDYMYDLSKDFGIKVFSITAPSKGIDEETINKILSLAKKLDTQLVTFSPPYFKDSNVSWFSEYLQKVKKDVSFSIAIKNIDPEFYLLILPKYKKASFVDIKKITGDSALDVSSIDNSSGTDINKVYKILGNSVKNVYLSDRQGNQTGLLPGNAGGGISHLPLESFLMKLKTGGYKGFISLKVNTEALGVGNEKLVMENFGNVMEYYNKHYLNYK